MVRTGKHCLGQAGARDRAHSGCGLKEGGRHLASWPSSRERCVLREWHTLTLFFGRFETFLRLFVPEPSVLSRWVIESRIRKFSRYHFRLGTPTAYQHATTRRLRSLRAKRPRYSDDGVNCFNFVGVADRPAKAVRTPHLRHHTVFGARRAH